MLPQIYIGERAIPTYGLLAGMGILLAVLYLKCRERGHASLQESADTEMAFLFGLIGTFVGAKFLSILTQLPEVIENWGLLFTHTTQFLNAYLLSGFVFYGGLYGCLLGVWLYTRRVKRPYSDFLSRMLPVVPLVHAFGRVGCFCTGCCYGIPHDTLGVYFTASAIAPHDVPLLPVQLYEAGLEVGLFALLHWMSRKGQKGEKMLGAYLCLYGVARFLLEFLRGDAYRGFIGFLSVSQVISIPTVIWGVMLLKKSGGKQRKKTLSL